MSEVQRLNELLEEAADALDVAWGLIANAGMNLRQGPVVHVMDDGTEVREAGWHCESAEWEAAAIRWRDEQFHPFLNHGYSFMKGETSV